MTLISFWATWCGSCIDEFADLEETYLMYQVRDFDLVTVAGQHARRKARRAENAREKARHQPQSAFRFRRHRRAASRLRSHVAIRGALHRPARLPTAKFSTRTWAAWTSSNCAAPFWPILPSDYIGFNQYWQQALAQNEHGQKRRPIDRVSTVDNHQLPRAHANCVLYSVRRVDDEILLSLSTVIFVSAH